MLEWILSSCVLILVLIALRRLLRGRISLRLQYALWLLVLVRLLVPVNFGSTPFSVTNALSETPALPLVTYTGDLGRPAPEPAVGAETSSAADVPAAEAPAPGLSLVTEPGAPLPANTTAISLSRILTLIWIWGAILAALLLLSANLRFARLLSQQRSPAPGCDAPLPVYRAGSLDTPCLFGLFRPAIYVTDEVLADPAALGHVLAHEATHFRHGDHIWSVLRGLCLALHWYNPLVWWAAALSRRDAELACDEGALLRLGEDHRLAYGRTLIALSCRKPGGLLLTATTMTGSKRSLKERIRLIAKKPRMAVYTLIAVVLAATIAVGCTFTGSKVPEGPAGTPVFDPEREIAAVTLHHAGTGDAVAVTGRLEELTLWLRSFTYGEALEGAAAPGSHEYSVTVTYSDGTAQRCGVDVAELDGVEYSVERDELPDCWHTVWSGTSISSPEPPEGSSDPEAAPDMTPSAPMDCVPEAVTELTGATLIMEHGVYSVTDEASLQWLEDHFSAAAELPGGAGCPFSSVLQLYRADGTVLQAQPAEDSCGVFRAGDRAFQYDTGNETFFALFGVEAYHTEYEYDLSGRLIRSTDYVWNTPTSHTEYAYNEHGLLAETYHSGDGSLLRLTEYEYDAHGNNVRETCRDNGVLQYRLERQFDARGNCIETSRYEGDGSWLKTHTYTYDEQDRCIETVYQDVTGGAFRETYVYDAAGNWVETASYSDDGSLSHRQVFAYDASGNCIRQDYILADGTVETWWEYGYDSTGQLTGTRQYDRDGRLMEAW